MWWARKISTLSQRAKKIESGMQAALYQRTRKTHVYERCRVKRGRSLISRTSQQRQTEIVCPRSLFLSLQSSLLHRSNTSVMQRGESRTWFIPLVFLHSALPNPISSFTADTEKNEVATLTCRSTYLVEPLIRRSCTSRSSSLFYLTVKLCLRGKPLNLTIYDSSASPQLFHYGDPQKTNRIMIVEWISWINFQEMWYDNKRITNLIYDTFL